MKIRDIKESVACIYKLTFPDGKIYIGQTKDLKKRMQLYLFCNDRKATGVTSIIRSFGIDSVDVEVLCRITGMNEVDERLCLNILEIHYISEMNSLEPNGYNTSLGGEIFGIPNEVLAMSSDEVKNYYRGGCKPVLEYDASGKFVREYKSIADCAYQLGVKDDTVRLYLTKNKMLHGKHILRKKRGMDIPQEISVADVETVTKVKKVYVTKEVEKEVEKKVYKEVVVEKPKIERVSPCVLYDSDGELVGEYKHKSEAERAAGFQSTVPYGRYRNGYILFRRGLNVQTKIEPMEEMSKYILEDYYVPLCDCQLRTKPVSLVGVKHRSTRKGRHSIIYNNSPIAQFTLDGELVAEYDSTRDASEATGIPYSGIYACVNGKTKKSNGFVWKKIEK